jgi:hypothetical protein
MWTEMPFLFTSLWTKIFFFTLLAFQVAKALADGGWEGEWGEGAQDLSKQQLNGRLLLRGFQPEERFLL